VRPSVPGTDSSPAGEIETPEIDPDNLRIFNSVSSDPIDLRSPPYEGINFVYPLQNAQFLLLSVADRHRLIITSTADDLSEGTNIDNLEPP